MNGNSQNHFPNIPGAYLRNGKKFNKSFHRFSPPLCVVLPFTKNRIEKANKMAKLIIFAKNETSFPVSICEKCRYLLIK